MALSAAAALWLLLRLSGGRAFWFGLFATAALALCLYFAGRIQRAGRRQAPFVALLSCIIVVAAVARVPASATSHLSRASGAESWSETRAGNYVQQGKPVFVYFTADWCLSCKVNETTSIDRSEVRDAFKQAGVEVLAADWTNGDPAITRFLESRGRAGVPLYLWYAPGKPPEELPQLLTPAMLIDRARSLKR